MKKLQIKIKEKELQKTILDYLAIKRIFHFRNNSGAMVSEYQGKQRFMRFGASGSPDIIAVIKGKFIGIEVKGTGGKQSEAQKKFQRELEKAGGIYLLIYSLEDIEQILKSLQLGFFTDRIPKNLIASIPKAEKSEIKR